MFLMKPIVTGYIFYFISTYFIIYDPNNDVKWFMLFINFPSTSVVGLKNKC